MKNNLWLDQVSVKHSVTKFLVLSWIVIMVIGFKFSDFTVTPSAYTGALRYAMYLYWLGWVLLVFAPQIFALRAAWDGFEPKKWLSTLGLGDVLPSWKLLLLVGITRPLSIFVIHYELNKQTGKWYWDYLTASPIFLVTDLLIPALFIVFAWREYDNAKLLGDKDPDPNKYSFETK